MVKERRFPASEYTEHTIQMISLCMYPGGKYLEKNPLLLIILFTLE